MLSLLLIPLALAGTVEAPPLEPDQSAAIFAGGCFWCVEAAFDDVPGVISATSGYTGGTLKHPTYGVVGHLEDQHKEAVRVVFNPKKVTYEQLMYLYWRNVDPFDLDGQFCDQGTSYEPVVFVADDYQRRAAEASKAVAEERLHAQIQVPIRDATTFWVAEDFHQDYHKLNSVKYTYYRWACGRDARLDEVWGGEARGAAKH